MAVVGVIASARVTASLVKGTSYGLGDASRVKVMIKAVARVRVRCFDLRSG